MIYSCKITKSFVVILLKGLSQTISHEIFHKLSKKRGFGALNFLKCLPEYLLKTNFGKKSGIFTLKIRNVECGSFESEHRIAKKIPNSGPQTLGKRGSRLGLSFLRD